MPRPNGDLLDTNIVVALVRNNALGQYLDRTYRFTNGNHAFHIAVVVVGETRALAAKWRWGPVRVARLGIVMIPFTRLDISDETVLNAYAGLDAGSAAVGIDLWIAAVAQVYDLTLLTTDRDFDHLHLGGLVDVEWVDPTSA